METVVLNSKDRNEVERYKEEHGNELEVDILLYKSRHQLNVGEKCAAIVWKGRRETERDEKEAKRYFEDNKSSFKEMGYQASIEYLRKQNLSRGVLVKVEIKVANLLQK